MNIFFILQLVGLIVLTIYLVILIPILIVNAYARITNKSIIDVPFVPVPDKALIELATHIVINEKTKLYDLGSGNGKIIDYLYRANKKGKYIGIERNLFPYLLSKWKTRNISNTDVSFVLGDINTTNLSSATHITMYLFPEFVDSLLPKFQNELASGVRVYSIDYPFSKKEPVQIILVNTHGLGKKLYVYEF